MARLTSRRVEAAAPRSKPWCMWCTDLPGFGCRISPGGTRTYVVRYRNRAGATRTFTIGSAARLPADLARDHALQVFAAVARGDDPAASRADYRQAPTMADLFDRWAAEYAPKLRASTVRAYRQVWAAYMAPAWAARKVQDLDQDAVGRLHAQMGATPYLANRMLAFTSVLLNLAEGWKMRPVRSNPCHLVRRYPERRRGMVPEPAQLPALWQAIDALRTLAAAARYPAMTRRHAGFFALLLLTGCRRGELLGARADQVRRDRQVLVLPTTKTDCGQPQVVELTPEALAVIDALPAEPGSPWLFPGRLVGQHMAPPYRRWKAVARAAGMPGMRLHDLRHTVGTYAHQAGASQRVVAQLLRHRQLSTTERYTHGFDSARRAAAVATTQALAPK